jgi:lysine-specific histone demethylase 1B
MKRRDFLRQSAFISLGGILLPSGLLSSCRKESLFEELDYKGKVLIVGAGAAGLYAAYLLQSKGIDCTVFEASATHGGRLGKLSGFADYDIDTGAQWLHGRNNLLGDLIQKTGTPITLDDSELSYWFNNQVVTNLPSDPFIFEEDDLPDVSFKDYAHQQGFGAEYDYIVEAIAGDQGASASLLSAYWNSQEEQNWASGDEDFKFRGTFFDFLHQHIAEPVLGKVRFNTPITRIAYGGDGVILTDSSGTEWTGDKVIVTVPISLLKLNEIAFEPPLPAEKTAAFSHFGMGPGMKVFLKFSSRFYPQGLYGGAVCAAYQDDSVGKETGDHVLLAFVMGDQAAALHALGSDAAITNALLAELDQIFDGQATASFLASSVHDYTSKPFIKGAYSFSTVGMGNAREVAAQPVGDKLFFAGEAMNVNGHHQTVHGAVESGYKSVIDILNSIEE